MAKRASIEKLLPAVDTLTPAECVALRDALRVRTQRLERAVLIQERAEALVACPHCAHAKITRHGFRKGVPRFRCAACRKTFGPTTGTPLAGLRHPDKHLANARCMIDGMSVRKAAKRLGVHKDTAFRWRHRFLSVLQAQQPAPAALSGVVEADETFFLESFKGKKSGMPRTPRTRGGVAGTRGTGPEQIPVLVARDRTGATLSVVLPSTKGAAIEAALAPVLAPDAVLCSDGANSYKGIARRRGLTHHALPATKSGKRVRRRDNAFHINNVNAYDSRLKGWMFRFHGVATKNLPNYFGWHRFLDAQKATTARSFWQTAMGWA